MELETIKLLLAAGIPCFGIAIQWGITKAEVTGMKETIANQQTALEKLAAESIRKGECQERHARADKSIDEIKADLRDIKKLLMDRLPLMREGA